MKRGLLFSNVAGSLFLKDSIFQIFLGRKLDSRFATFLTKIFESLYYHQL